MPINEEMMANHISLTYSPKSVNNRRSFQHSKGTQQGYIFFLGIIFLVYAFPNCHALGAPASKFMVLAKLLGGNFGDNAESGHPLLSPGVTTLRQLGDEAALVEQTDPSLIVVGGSGKEGDKPVANDSGSRIEPRISKADAATEATAATTATEATTATKPTVAATSPSTPVTTAAVVANTTTAANTTTTATPTTVKPPPTVANYNITLIDYKNYTYVDHTSFIHTVNGWDFDGTWGKNDLSAMDASIRPIPTLPWNPKLKRRSRVEAGGNPGSATGAQGGESPHSDAKNPAMLTGGKPSDGKPASAPADKLQNNFVLVSYASTSLGTLSKAFSPLTKGEVALNYYAVRPQTNFTITLLNANNTRHTLYNNTAPNSNATSKVWTARMFKFNETHTLSKKFKIILEINTPNAVATKETAALFAVHHIALGGMLTPAMLTTTTTPPPNATIFPPGSLNEIRAISSAIWVALYVFLAFFLLCIVALIVLIARGRCR